MPPNHGSSRIEIAPRNSPNSRMQFSEESTQTEDSGTMTNYSDFDGSQIESEEQTEGVIERLSRLFSAVRISDLLIYFMNQKDKS